MEQRIQSFDEVNLYDLWRIMVKRKKLLIVLFLTAIVLTAIVSSLMPKIYRGEALLNILQYEAMPEKEKEIIDAKEIVDMIGTVDREKRAKILPRTNIAVTDIKVKALKESKDKILVFIDAKNADDIPDALSEFVDYLNNFQIVKLTVTQEKEKLLKRSSELSEVIQSSAGLSDTYRTLLKNGKLLPVGFNPLDLTKRISDIKVEKLIVDQRLQRLNAGGIEIAKQPYINSKPVKPKIMLNVVLAGLTSILFGFLIVFFSHYMDRIKEREGA